ncbi:MAG: hypothetical protein KJ065_15015 [Anaerolineae bacterium]|nr:hypothetical protein [Anaerolineae bacterium]
MRRLLASLVIFLAAVLSLSTVLAQDGQRAQRGDPPRTSLISISEPDENGIVTISGESNAVFPTAQVAIRNLYTGDTTYTQAGITGSFSTHLYGPGNTPFMISPAENIPQALRDRPGSLPGGPAVVVYRSYPTGIDGSYQFTVSGSLGSGAEHWAANGSVNRVVFETGDPNPLRLELDVTVPRPLAEVDLNEFRVIGQLELIPVVLRQNGETHPVSVRLTNNGWASALTPSGLAIDDVGSERLLAETAIGAADIAPVLNGLSFRLVFERQLPSNLPAGIYVPALKVLVRAGDAAPETWETSPLFGQGAGYSGTALTRLPLVFNVGSLESIELPWVLMMNTPTDGSRGLLPVGTDDYALSNRVHFNSPTYIVPLNADGAPATYSLEPHLLMQFPNAYAVSAPPLIPLLFPGGRLTLSIHQPDGTTLSPGNLPILQNQLSSPALDESEQFGRQSPVDTYQLATLNPNISRFSFNQYGEHVINLTGEFEDIFGNRYSGGGEYHILVAERLELSPAVLSGTPFEVGNALNPGLHVAPAIPADVTVTVRIYPLDGGEPTEQVFEGTANDYGYFSPQTSPFVFDQPGEYVIDYEARYEDSNGRLWAGSLRSAGVIAGETSDYVARGARGLANFTSGLQPAWYRAERLLAARNQTVSPVIANTPYHSGDVLWITDDVTSALAPTLRLQDRIGSYENWLLAGAATDASALGSIIRRAAAVDELPLALFGADGKPYDPAQRAAPASRGYTYVSFIHPGFSVRQMVSGAVIPSLPIWTDMQDPLNRQVGAGVNGLAAGDYVFLFGGAVVDNPDIDVRTTAIYGSLAVVVEADDPNGTRVASPGRASDGGTDGGPLLRIDDQAYNTFFLPTGVQPGDILPLGDTFAFSGQAAPARAARIDLRVTSPSGALRMFSGRANAIGYYYDPVNDFALDETGVWTVEVQVTQDGLTSAGVAQPPYLTGGIPGAPDGRFSFYVAEPESAPIEVTTRQDIQIPAALPYNFNFTVPNGWTAVSVYYTLTAPGFLIEQGTLRLSGRTFSYQHNPTNVARRFPNMEVDGRAHGVASSDPHRLTMMIIARDEVGRPRTSYRTFTIFHDRLISLNN